MGLVAKLVGKWPPGLRLQSREVETFRLPGNVLAVAGIPLARHLPPQAGFVQGVLFFVGIPAWILTGCRCRRDNTRMPFQERWYTLAV